MPKKSPSAKNAERTESPTFPPWGSLQVTHRLLLDKEPVPLQFRLKPGDSQPPTPTQWKGWLNGFVDEVSDFLWPRYKNGGWSGDAKDGALALTRADLALMAALRERMYMPIDSRFAATTIHKAIFEREDAAPPGPDFLSYDPVAFAALERNLAAAIRRGGGMVESLLMQLKLEFQRPRPYQAARMLEVTDFDWHRATSADTPSLVSGHCLQGCFALCNVFVELKLDLAAIPKATQHVQQFLIDGGDRRVFAGVHYPSDNISSWFTALRLCDHFFRGNNAAADRGQEVKDFLWQAIRERSHVYKALSEPHKLPGMEAYAEPMKALKAEAERKVPPRAPT